MTATAVGVSSATVRALASAYAANLGRPLSTDEVVEFRHVFSGCDPALVRRAIDEYATAGPEFMRLAGLRATYARIVAANRAGDGSKSAEAEREDAAKWLSSRAYEGAGFRFAGETGRPLDAVQVRGFVARHQVAHLECAFRFAKLWDRAKCDEAREVIRVCRDELARAGYEYVGHAGGFTGCLVVEFDATGRWYPRAVPPDALSRKTVGMEQFTARLVERQANLYAREWSALQAEVAKWFSARGAA